MKRFKDFLIEAFREKDLAKASMLMKNYLQKKIGKQLFEDSEAEVFKKADSTSGVGMRYYTEDGTSIRFNMIKQLGSADINSIDIWTGTSRNPNFSIDADGDSVVKILPKIVNYIKNPIEGEYDLLESKNLPIFEGASEEIAALYQQGKTGSEIKKMGYKVSTVYAVKKKLGIASVNVKKGVGESVSPSPMYLKTKAMVEDDSKVFEQKMEDLEEIAKAVSSKVITSLLITGKAGTGKSFSVEKVLNKQGLKQGIDWLLVKAGVSPIGAYQILYKWRERIVVFDDADGIFKTDEGRNLLKAALDDKDVRKISWYKESNVVYPSEIKENDPEEADKLEKKGKVPNAFDFHGSAIFISNLDKNKADPDKTIQSRSMVIDINPTKQALLDRMETLLPKIGPENMSMKEKKEIFEYVKTSKSDEISLRKFVKAAKVKYAGLKNWQRLVENYA